MSDSVLNVTDSDFEEQVERSDIPVLVDFWADWCGPCRQLSPIIDQLFSEKNGELKIVKLNVDENIHTSTKYSLRSLPTMMLFNNGKQIGTKVGALSKSDILKWIDSCIKNG